MGFSSTAVGYLYRYGSTSTAPSLPVRSASIPNIDFASTERYMGVVYYVDGGTKIVSGAVNSWLASVPGDTQITGTSMT